MRSNEKLNQSGSISLFAMPWLLQKPHLTSYRRSWWRTCYL